MGDRTHIYLHGNMILIKRIFFLLLFAGITVDLISQDFIPDLNPAKVLRQDTSNIYFKQIWIESRDVNSDDIAGYIRRATEKIELGYYRQALRDVNTVMSLDSAMSQAYSLRGYLMLRSDSLMAAVSDFKKAILLNDTVIFNYQYLAEIQLHMGHLQEADSLFRKILTMNPDFVYAHFGLGNVCYFKGEYDKAEREFKNVLKLDPSFALAHYNMAIMYMFTDPDRAIRNLNKAVDVDPKLANAYFVIGYLQMKKNKPDLTEKNWKKAIEADSANSFYRISMGLLKINRGEFAEGFMEIQKLLNKPRFKNYVDDFEKSEMEKQISSYLSQAYTFSKYSEYLKDDDKSELINAMSLSYMGNFPQAESIYQKQIAKTKRPGLVYYLRGYNLEYCQQPDLSLKCYLAAESQEIFPAEVWLRQGIIYIITEKYRPAIQSLKKYIDYDNGSKTAYLSLGNAYLGISVYDSAIYNYSNVLKIDSMSLDVLKSRAFCYSRTSRYEDAIGDYNKLIRYRQNDVETIGIAAQCYIEAGDTTGAFELLNRTFCRYHNLSDEGYYLRGMINLWKMQFDSAIFNFNKVIYVEVHQDIYTFRGLAYYCRQDYKAAKSDLVIAVNNNGDDVTALYTLGMVNIKLGEKDDAFKHLSKAESLGHPLARRSISIFLKGYKPPG